MGWIRRPELKVPSNRQWVHQFYYPLEFHGLNSRWLRTRRGPWHIQKSRRSTLVLAQGVLKGPPRCLHGQAQSFHSQLLLCLSYSNGAWTGTSGHVFVIIRCVKAATKISDFLTTLRGEFNPSFGSYPSTLTFKCIKGMHRTIKILFIKKGSGGGGLCSERAWKSVFLLFFFPLLHSLVPRPPNDPTAVVKMAAVWPSRIP